MFLMYKFISFCNKYIQFPNQKQKKKDSFLIRLYNYLIEKQMYLNQYLQLVILSITFKQSTSQETQNLEGCFLDGYYQCEICNCSYPFYLSLIAAIFAFITLFAFLTIIIGFLRVKELRKQPGDIIFFWAIFGLFLSIGTIQFSIGEWENENNLEEISTSCHISSYFSMVGTVGKIGYTISLMVYYAVSLRGSLKNFSLPFYLYHIVPLGTSAIWLHEFWNTQIGMSYYGYCLSKTQSSLLSYMETTGSYQIILFVIFPIYLIITTSKYIKKWKAGDISFLVCYSRFVIAISIMYILETATNALLILALQSAPSATINQILALMKITGNILKDIEPFLLVWVRLTDPELKKHWQKIISILREDEKSQELEIPLTVISERSSRASSIDINTLQNNILKGSLIEQAQHNLKVQIIYSYLSSLHYYFNFSQYSPNEIENNILIGELQDIVKEQVIVPINHKLYKSAMPSVILEIEQKLYEIENGTLTVFGASYFKKIIELDYSLDEMKQSLDLGINFKRILKAGINGGGKSGEFFFFSADNKLILKTISQEEHFHLLKVLPKYLEYLKQNEDSLLAKIYGLFVFEKSDPLEKYIIMLMRNVNGFPSNAIKRIYDLKGSTFERRTVKNQITVPFEELSLYGNLKDLDFLKYDKKIYIHPDIKGFCFEQLKNDAQFLSEIGVIDYSFIVYLIEKSDGLNKCDTRMSKFHCQPSTKENKVYYHFGIIDYLTPYTLKKSLAKLSKKVMNINPKLDCSVQEPQPYAERFVRFMQEGFFQQILTPFYSLYIFFVDYIFHYQSSRQNFIFLKPYRKSNIQLCKI